MQFWWHWHPFLLLEVNIAVERTCYDSRLFFDYRSGPKLDRSQRVGVWTALCNYSSLVFCTIMRRPQRGD